MSALPQVTLKLATSLDARIALSNGVSQWITGPEARARVHEMRAAHGAVLVGAGTVRADDPLLTVRTVPLPEAQPVRIVADSRAGLSPESRLAQSAGLGRVVVAHAGADAERLGRLKAAGVDGWDCTDTKTGRVSPRELLRRCGDEGIASVFLEGGGELAASFLREELVTRLKWFRAPILLGGDGLAAMGALGLSEIEAAPRWQLEDRETIGSDTLETWTPV